MPDYNPSLNENLVQRTTIFDDDMDKEKQGFNDVAKQFIREFNATDELVIDKLGGLGSVILAGVASVTTNGAGIGTTTVNLGVELATANYGVFLTADGTALLPNGFNAESRTTTTFVIRVVTTGAETFPISWMVCF